MILLIVHLCKTIVTSPFTLSSLGRSMNQNHKGAGNYSCFLSSYMRLRLLFKIYINMTRSLILNNGSMMLVGGMLI